MALDDFAELERLQTISRSRKHLPETGPCFKALGQEGCPCCDAEYELHERIDDMVDELRRLRNLLKEYWDAEQARCKAVGDESVTGETFAKVFRRATEAHEALKEEGHRIAEVLPIGDDG